MKNHGYKPGDVYNHPQIGKCHIVTIDEDGFAQVLPQSAIDNAPYKIVEKGPEMSDAAKLTEQFKRLAPKESISILEGKLEQAERERDEALTALEWFVELLQYDERGAYEFGGYKNAEAILKKAGRI